MVCLRSGLRPSLRHTTLTVPQRSHQHLHRNREGVTGSLSRAIGRATSLREAGSISRERSVGFVRLTCCRC